MEVVTVSNGEKAYVWVYVGDEGGVVSVYRISMGRVLTEEGFFFFFFFSPDEYHANMFYLNLFHCNDK